MRDLTCDAIACCINFVVMAKLVWRPLTFVMTFVNYIYIYKLIYFLKRHKAVPLETPFRDGQNLLRYSLHLPTEGWPG